MSFFVLWRCLVARWRVALAVFLGGLAGVMLYVGSMPDVYSARAVVVFTPRLGAGVGAAELRTLLPSYVVYLTAPSTMERLAPLTGEDRATLKEALQVQLVSETSNLTVSVTLAEPARAARVANVWADEALSFAKEDVLLRARVVAPAVPDTQPSGPPRRLFEAAGLLVAAFMAAAVSVLLERGRLRVRTWQEVARATGHPVIGRVPVSRHLGGETWDDPAFDAAIRSIRTSLARQSSGAPVRALVVTSSLPGEGKTTVAAALSMALVRLGTSVLLVDADVHGRGLSRRFGLRPGAGPGQKPGLADVLRGEASLEGCVRPGPLPGLSVLPTSVEADGSDLFARHFGRVLEAARERFEVVVVDAPPLLVGDDAGTLAVGCDAALLVVARDTPAHLAGEAAAGLRDLGVRVLGAVANGAREPWVVGHQPVSVGESQN
jgi:Mrp family chromosome partitioning ATPase